jgi:DNA helicase II / ATP-dependent DNA helicase PcrA
MMCYSKMANILIIAAAGSGKTSEIINRTLAVKDKPILITTYTQANAIEIQNKLIKRNGCIPNNVTIDTWFSLLIKHGIKPYQNFVFEEKVKGLILVNTKSAFRFKTKLGIPIYWGESDFYMHYFTKDYRVYSDKLSKLVFKINSASEDKVIDRLTKIFPIIFIDECQDLAGYDLDLIKELAKKVKELTLVCDPRQVTYLTHIEAKNSQYKDGLIEDYIKDKCKRIPFIIDKTTLSNSHRSNQQICDLSNKLYAEYPECNSSQIEQTEHDGIFLVDKEDKDEYLNRYKPIQLRWNIANKDVNLDYDAFNFGESKGLTFDRVLIYPTADMVNWLRDHAFELKNETRAKFYVGITRAKFSVGIFCDTEVEFDMNGINKFER